MTDKKITILFEKESLNIIKSYDNFTGQNFPVLAPNQNIYNWAKSIKPAPEEFGTLSTLLMNLKRHEPCNKVYTFSNNGNFLTDFLLGPDNKNKPSKHFNLQYLSCNDTNYNKIEISLSFRSLAHDDGMQNITAGATAAQLRHELINPLHAIKLSGDLIRRHIRDTAKLSPSDIDKYNNIILNEVNNSLDIIETLTSKQQPALEKIALSTFNLYIQNQINLINQTYFMYSPVKIEWGAIEDDNYAITHYVFLNTNYMKIILDNIFKNIYGHLDRLNPINSFNKFNIQFAGNEIRITINNKCPTISTDKPGLLLSKISKQRQSVIDRYDLVVNSPSTVLDTGKKQSIGDQTKTGTGIGLSLINNLCQKMGVKWNLIDNDTEICFQLSIPVLGDSRQLGHFTRPQLVRRQTVQCTL